MWCGECGVCTYGECVCGVCMGGVCMCCVCVWCVYIVCICVWCGECGGVCVCMCVWCNVCGVVSVACVCMCGECVCVCVSPCSHGHNLQNPTCGCFPAGWSEAKVSKPRPPTEPLPFERGRDSTCPGHPLWGLVQAWRRLLARRLPWLPPPGCAHHL